MFVKTQLARSRSLSLPLPFLSSFFLPYQSVQIHAHGGQRSASYIIAQIPSTLFILRHSLTLTWNSAAWTVSSRDLALGLQADATTPAIFKVGSGDQIQVLMLAWQALYPRSCVPAPLQEFLLKSCQNPWWTRESPGLPLTLSSLSLVPISTKEGGEHSVVYRLTL